MHRHLKSATVAFVVVVALGSVLTSLASAQGPSWYYSYYPGAPGYSPDHTEFNNYCGSTAPWYYASPYYFQGCFNVYYPTIKPTKMKPLPQPIYSKVKVICPTPQPPQVIYVPPPQVQIICPTPQPPQVIYVPPPQVICPTPQPSYPNCPTGYAPTTCPNFGGIDLNTIPWGTFGTYANWVAKFKQEHCRWPTCQDIADFWYSQEYAARYGVSPFPPSYCGN